MIGIVGAGFAGLFCAWNLTERNIPCAVVGKIETAASFAAQGVIGNKGLFIAESELFENKIRGARAISTFCRDLQRTSGKKIIFESLVFEPFSSLDDWRRTQRRVYRGEFYGCYGVKLFQGEEIKVLLPQLSLQPAVTMQYCFDSFVDVEVLLTTMREILSKRGVRFIDEQITSLSWNRKWVFSGENGHVLESNNLFLAPGSGISFFRDCLELDIPSAKLVSGYTYSFEEEDLACEEFALLHETHAFCQFSNRCTLGSTSRKGALDLSLVGSDFVELKNIFADRLDLRRMQKNLVVKGGERVFYKNMKPICGVFESKRFSQPIYIISGLYKNGLQLAPILSGELVREFVLRSSA